MAIVAGNSQCLTASRAVIETSILAGIVLALLTAGAMLRYGSLGSAAAALNGYGLVVDESRKDLGEVGRDTKKIVNFNLTNITGRPINLLGVDASCKCTFVNTKFPITIQANTSYDLQVTTESPSSPLQPFRQRVRLYTDLPAQPEMLVEVIGKVRR